MPSPLPSLSVFLDPPLLPLPPKRLIEVIEAVAAVVLLVRLQSDAFLALALVHHLCIGGNVPIPQVVEVLHGLAPAGVVEWVDKSDPMVQRMLRNRSDVFVDYTWERFRLEVEKVFKIVAIEETHGGSRRLCLLLSQA